MEIECTEIRLYIEEGNYYGRRLSGYLTVGKKEREILMKYMFDGGEVEEIVVHIPYFKRKYVIKKAYFGGSLNFTHDGFEFPFHCLGVDWQTVGAPKVLA